jgi:hypothetical protein
MDVKLSALRAGRALLPRNFFSASGALLEAELLHSHSAAGRVRQIEKKFNGLIGHRTRYATTCPHFTLPLPYQVFLINRSNIRVEIIGLWDTKPCFLVDGISASGTPVSLCQDAPPKRCYPYTILDSAKSAKTFTAGDNDIGSKERSKVKVKLSPCLIK